MNKGKIVITIVIFFITVTLISLMFIQFRTVEESNLLGIETMREEELRQEILAWKTKYNELDEKIQSNNTKINEYTDIITNNKQASEVLDAELNEYNMLVGKTNVVGEGIIVASPYEVKAIGNKQEFEKILNFPNSGFIPDYKNRGYTIDFNLQSEIRIPAYSHQLNLKYVKEAE